MRPTSRSAIRPIAFLVTSAIAKGRIDRLDLDDARAVPGVLDILTHENTGRAQSR